MNFKHDEKLHEDQQHEISSSTQRLFNIRIKSVVINIMIILLILYFRSLKYDIVINKSK